ncbi:MAG TPA: CsbD family protein [Pirellulales bacterium]|nr:CsbD family protein [Pirellulales bacterium]
MAGKAEEVKGRVKEAAGALADNDKMRREGKIDQAAGKVKQAAEKVVEKVKDRAKQINRDS